jgi:hypothetical protein
MFFLQIARHSPESCPLHNEGAKIAYNKFYAKLNELLSKHSIKMVGGWVSTPEHLTVVIYDLQNPENIIGFMREPEVSAWLSYQVTETKPVLMLDEVMKMLK